MSILSNLISVKRRYSRSVNLERDLEIADSVIGYIPTSRAVDMLERFFHAYSQSNSVRAWTLTGAYGTGKSAFAHFLSSLCAPVEDQTKINAIQILLQTVKKNSLHQLIKSDLPDRGLLRAVVAAQREPIANTVVKALDRGTSVFWRNIRGPRPKVLSELNELVYQISNGEKIDNQRLIHVISSLASASKSGILLIIDELGKNFEFSAHNQSLDDLYLLQQLAELPSGEQDPKIFIIGLLHQSFVDYASGLTAAQRNEWAKIQGRFEDLPFIDSPEGMMRLIGHAIDQSNAISILPQIRKVAKQWYDAFKEHDFANNISSKEISAVYPLHPLTAFVLPILCAKYSQNDRTLFTFLSSGEPNSFNSFIKGTSTENRNIPTLKLHKLYDYFIEAVGMSFSLRPQFQRWVEIQSRISDAKSLDHNAVAVLKTIGILNLISNTGTLRANRSLVALAMCDSPDSQKELRIYNKTVDLLIFKGFLTWRKQLDELRIWEGSDFDIEKEISEQTQMLNISLADLFNEFFPLKPLIAQRHSYQTGTMRYFERRYFDDLKTINPINCKSSDSDGLICYWLGSESNLKKIPTETEDGKPVIFLCASELNALQVACYEYVALKKIDKNTTQLQSDGVARREVKQRILFAKRLLDEALFRSFDVTSNDFICFNQGKRINFDSQSSFKKCLSDVCDKVFDKGLKLWNELVNRRQTTSQGSAARRMLIEAMLKNSGQAQLGISGKGPEFSLFESLLRETGIYREEGGHWFFSEPDENSGVYDVWKAIESFCLSATATAKEITSLYEILEAPPYGVKQGVIPIILVSVLLKHSDNVSVYMDGTFLPILGPEHFELFFRKPDRFSVKYFQISGLRAQIFKELEGIFSTNTAKFDSGIRNTTILNIVKPLVSFITKLPSYTLNTKERLSSKARAVRHALLTAKEPDDLLFKELPQACGVLFISADETTDNKVARIFRANLVQALKELQSAYEILLSDCNELLYGAFSIRSDIEKTREDLRVRASYLSGQVTEEFLKRFIFAAAEEDNNERSWLETILMIIADKPPRVWTDNDATVFETKLTDISRRFKNLEALQKEFSIVQGDGFDVSRVTVTKPNGEETHQMVWIEREKQEKIEKIAQAIINDNEIIKEAVTAVLIEKVFGTAKTKNVTFQVNQKRKDIKIG